MEDESDIDDVKLTQLSKTIEALQNEKLELGNENKEVKEKINKLTLELNELRKKEEETGQETDDWEDDETVLESLASRSADLENEVSRLQHDLINSMSEIDEANKETIELKRGLEEKASVIESMEKEILELKKEKLEMEKKERELERKLGVLEVREIEERCKKLRIEEEMKEKIDGLKKKIDALEAEAERTRVELEKRNVPKLEIEERAMVFESKEVVGRKTSQATKARSRDTAFKGWFLKVPIVTVGSTVAILSAIAVMYLYRIKPSD